MFLTETVLCSFLTALLVYVSTFDLDAIELLLLILCFVAVIWILAAPNAGHAKSTLERFENAMGWRVFDVDAYGELADLPTKVKDLIQPPIEKMIQNSNQSDSSSDVKNLERIPEKRYVDAEDTYVGNVESVIVRDLFGKESTTQKLVLQEDKFKAMKLEYKKLDAMLAKLREGDNALYAKLVPQGVVKQEEY